MKHFTENDEGNLMIESITCDVCNQCFKGENHTVNIHTFFCEEAEFFSYRDILSIDLCEKCLYTYVQEKGLLERCVKNTKDYCIDFEVWAKSVEEEQRVK